MAIRRDVELLVLGALAGLGLASAVAQPVPAGEPVPAGQSPRDPPARPRDLIRQPGRGREASSPTQIPARGWWQIAKRVYAKVNDDRVLAEAAGVTFYALLALFPALAAMVSLYGLFADPSTIQQNLNTIGGVVPGGGMQIISDQLHALASKGNGALGFGLILGLLTSLWSANAGIKALFDALNVVYEEHEKRGYVHRTLLSLAFTVGAIAFVIVAIAATIVLPAVLGAVGLGGTTDLLLKLARWPVLLLVVAAFLASVYRYGPSRTHARWRWVSGGSLFAAVVWVIASALFSFYVSNFGSYDKTYGSLGAAIGFMTWIWISTTIVLVGGELNAEMEHQTARDTTLANRPLGQRGAVKADTVAA